MATVFYRK